MKTYEMFADSLNPTQYKFRIPGREEIIIVDNITSVEALVLLTQYLRELTDDFLPCKSYINGKFCGFRGL